MLQQTDPCSKCGSHDGWYEKRICKYTQIFEACGDAFDAIDMARVRGGDRRYCNTCNKDITTEIKEVQQ